MEIPDFFEQFWRFQIYNQKHILKIIKILKYIDMMSTSTQIQNCKKLLGFFFFITKGKG